MRRGQGTGLAQPRSEGLWGLTAAPFTGTEVVEGARETRGIGWTKQERFRW